MTIRLRLILLILILVMLVHMIIQIRNHKLQLQYTLTWLLLMLGLAIVIWFPGLLAWFSSFLGIYTPINMVFFVGFCVSTLIIYQLTCAVSKLSEQVKTLTQKIGLLEKEITDRKDQ